MSIHERTSLADLLSYWDRVEEWRPIDGWPAYQVSSFGRVRGPRVILSPASVGGYHVVSLVRDGETKNRRIHSLVVEAFIGPAPFPDALIAHNDGDRTNNRVSNLRWASATENQADRVRHGTRARGSDLKHAKLCEDDIPAIRERARSGERYADIAEDYGVSVSTVHLIKKGATWRHVTGAAWRKTA